MRISDWSSGVCSSDLLRARRFRPQGRARAHDPPASDGRKAPEERAGKRGAAHHLQRCRHERRHGGARQRSEEHTSELQSLMRISYAVFCLKKKKRKNTSKQKVIIKKKKKIRTNTHAAHLK